MSTPIPSRSTRDSAPAPRSWAGLVGSIRLGQALITATLLIAGAVRAAADGVPIALTAAVAVAFAGWYAAGLVLSTRTADRPLAAWWLLGLALIWVGAVAVSAEFVWLAFSLWLLAGFALRMRWAIPYSLIVLVVVLVAPVAHTGSTSSANVIGPVVGGLFALGIARGYLELVRDGRERRLLIASLVAAQDETAALQDELARTQRESGVHAERTRLSRDIHDTVAQSMTSIGMLARGALDGAARGTGAEASRALRQIDELARDGLADTRRIVNALMPAELDGTALGDALARMLDRLQDETGIRTELHVDAGFPALAPATEVALLRVTQSALANVRSHADARRVVVTLADAGDTVRLDVADDGTGFDAQRWNARAARAGDGGYGMRAMRTRLRELGGGLDVESTPGEGTALSAHLPRLAEARP
nr:sensor histidine kinase [Microbacterium bovistercoris]